MKFRNKENQEGNISREVFIEKIAQLAESLREIYPSSAGILFGLSASMQIKQEDVMLSFLIPFLTEQKNMIKKMMEEK